MPLEIAPGTQCVNCRTREATIMWVGKGSVMDWNHGGWDPWCAVCAKQANLDHAREMAKLIPALEMELAQLLRVS